MKLRNIGRKHLLVEACNDCVNMTDVYSLNDTAAQLWLYMSSGTTDTNQLAQRMSEVFDVEPSIAAADINRQIDEWDRLGLLQH